MYCLVTKVNGEYTPITNSKRRYEAIRLGIRLMASVANYSAAKFNGITEFEIWTSGKEAATLNDVKLYYTMGYNDANTKNKQKKPKELSIVGLSIKHEAYKMGYEMGDSSSYIGQQTSYF